MNAHRIGQILTLCAALTAVGCGSDRMPGRELGTLQARLGSGSTEVQAVLVTVTGPGITGDVRATMTNDGNGNWAGYVPNVPAGVGSRTVTAYAYKTSAIPLDPIASVTSLIYKGSTSGVSVTPGNVTNVMIVLLPFPNDTGKTGINTPPHITGVSYPAWIDSGATASLSATAVDPDDVAQLTYAWDDSLDTDTTNGTGPRGTFTNSDGTDKLTGVPALVLYTPPAGFLGTVTIHLSITDGTATVATSFHLAVGSGVAPSLWFDSGPQLTMVSVQRQELPPGGSTVITYQVVGDPFAFFMSEGTAVWTSTCGGTFSPYESFQPLFPFPRDQTVTYTAPAVAPASPGQCDLKLSVLDDAGASAWSKVIVWVQPAVTGIWSGLATDSVRGPFEITFNMIQAGATVSGIYSTSFGGTGNFNGTLTGTDITFAVTVTNPGCPGTLIGTATVNLAATQMDVSYSGTTCMGATSGTGTGLGKSALPQNQKVVFVTSTKVDGAFFAGNPARADQFCQEHADAGVGPNKPPTGSYTAFVSFAGPGNSAGERIADGWYVLADGTLVATSKADLFDGTILRPINLDENGSATGNYPWTGTSQNGAVSTNCDSWTTNSNGVQGTAGATFLTNFLWTEENSGAPCGDMNPVYCVSQ